MIDRKRTACFTGHRSMPENDKAKLRIQLDRIIEALYNKGVVFSAAEEHMALTQKLNTLY